MDEIILNNDEIETLEHLSDMLHLSNHRNKNQHRRSIWWRHFSSLRHHLSEVIIDQRGLNEVPTTHLEQTRKVADDKARKIRLSHRKDLMQDVLVPKWHNAFSQLIADNRFAVLGVVLLAVLSQTCLIMGITKYYEDLGQREVERVLEEFGDTYWQDEMSREQSGTMTEEIGEVVARGDENEPVPSTVPIAQTLKPEDSARTELSTRRKVSSQPPKKKRKKANAIDDLFGGLG